MNILIASTKLAGVARTAAFAVRHQEGRRFPILNCCRLTADGNLSVYGTNLDMGIAASTDCDVLEPGEAVVEAHKLADITAKLKGDVSIQTTANDLIIKCGRSRFTLTALPAEDYPPPLAVDANILATDLTAADVMAIFAGAAAAAASNDTRIYLAGTVIFGEPTDFGHRLCGVGTDAIALSYAATTAACPDMGKGRIVHQDTCKLAVSLFGNTGAAMRLSDNLIELTSESVRLAAKLIGAEPTAWRTIVPPIDVANWALVTSADLKASLERCFAVINHLVGDLAKRAPSITLRWDAEVAPEVHVAFGDIRIAPACRDVIPAEELGGKVDISIDPKKLLRLLEGLDGESVCLSAGDRRSDPLRVDAGLLDRFAVLSPMREFSAGFEDAA